MVNVPGRFVRGRSGWRKLAPVVWTTPRDPSIHAKLKVDVSRARDMLAEVRAETGRHVTMTHMVARAVAGALAEHPECNAIVRRGRVYQRDHIDICVNVFVAPDTGDHEQGADLSTLTLRDVDRMTLPEMADRLATGADAIRHHQDPVFERTKAMLTRAPAGLLGALLRLATVAQYDLNLDLTALGLPRDGFGSAMVTTVGTFDIDGAFAPIPPITRLPAVIAVGAVRDEPVARDGAVVVRPMLPLYATIDHRVIDGFQGAQLSHSIQALLAEPPAAWGRMQGGEISL